MNSLFRCTRGPFANVLTTLTSTVPRQRPSRLAPIHEISQRSICCKPPLNVATLEGKKISFQKMNQAIKESNVEKLSEALKGLSVTEINSRDAEGKLPLNRAAEEFLKLKEDFSYEKENYSPEVVLTLLEKGASTTRTDAKNVRFRELLHQIMNKNNIGATDNKTQIGWKKVYELTYFSPINGDGYLHPFMLDKKNTQK